MSLSSFVLLIICVSVPFIEYVHSKEPELTEFGKKVKECMTNETYEKMFNVKKGSTDEDLKEAIKESNKKFAELLNMTYSKSEEGKVEKENKKLGIAHLNSSVLFHCQTYAISEAFRELGLLNSTNIDDLAQKYCDSFNKVAETLKKDDLVSTFIAIVTAVVDFLKTVGQTSINVIKKIEKAYNEEFKKYQPHQGLLESLLEVLPIHTM